MTSSLFKYPHVEDYIEIMAGYREVDGKNKYSLFSIDPVISLARYDMKVVPSLADQTMHQTKGYTDKQAKLAADLVLKYEKQFFKLGVDVSPVKTPQYRLPLRQIDRTTRVWIEDNLIKLKFPYDNTLIELVRKASHESLGRFYFNRQHRIHEADLTEWNLNWIYCFAQQNNMVIDSTVQDLMNLLLDAEKTDFRIELQYSDQGLTITNAESSLIEYVNNNLGGFDLNNILVLCDQAPVLGYSVHTDIQEQVIKQFNTRFWSLCANKNLKVDPTTSKNLVKELIEYATATNRFPIFIYEPDLSGRLLEEFAQHVPLEQICVLENKKSDQIDITAKIIYTTKIPRTPIGTIPLMVSSAGMIYGGDRQMWLQSAEKVVYFSKDVYNKNTKGKTVCKLN